MNKILALSLFMTFGFISCKTPAKEKKTDKLEIAKQYYKALDNAEGALMNSLLADSLLTVEADYDYEQIFSKRAYIDDWLKWDAVFKPTYKVLEIAEEDEIVKAKISKVDKRIKLLHEEPTVWNAIIRFDADRIVSIENSNVVFNDEVWERNRSKLLKWIDENHPELNGFLNGQTESAGMRYLKAIELYEDNN